MRLMISLLSALLLATALPAFAELPQSLDMGDNRAVICNTIGIAAYYEGRYESAESQFREVVRIEPQSAVAHFNLGLTLHKLGRHKDAADQFRAATKLAPENRMITQSETLKFHLTM